ncbi:MAG TPA: RNA polymerase sigma factor [Lachnospiraceae bacterium]|nr:RNA polymerase sigma factor [Lachnospiraceae bacterium]
MGTERDIRETVIKYSDMLYRICIVILCNEQDVQDVIQDTFCRYLEKAPDFHDEEHEKAWLIRVATNICRDMIRFRIRHPKVCIDELENSLAAPEHMEGGHSMEEVYSMEEWHSKETLRELLELPVKQKTVIYLHYVEGYQIKEIADILGITEGAVKMRLCRAREQMRMTWKEGYGR